MDEAKFYQNMFEISKSGNVLKMEIDYMHAFGLFMENGVADYTEDFLDAIKKFEVRGEVKTLTEKCADPVKKFISWLSGN